MNESIHPSNLSIYIPIYLSIYVGRYFSCLFWKFLCLSPPVFKRLTLYISQTLFLLFSHSFVYISIIIYLCKSTAERRPFPTPSITAYFVLFFAIYSCKYFNLVPPSCIRPFFNFVYHYTNTSQSVSSSIYCLSS